MMGLVPEGFSLGSDVSVRLSIEGMVVLGSI